MLSLARQSSRLLSRSSRVLHASARSLRDLIGPPDPISHLRPIIYDDVPTPPPPSLLHHPYSLAEFDPEPSNNESAHELQWKLQRKQLDDLNQYFWLDSNIRFESGKKAVLESLPLTASVMDKENALSEFYKHWLMQEKPRLEEYTHAYRTRNVTVVVLAARATLDRFKRRLANAFNLSKDGTALRK
ncbi:hypothetical protein E1B28_008857 [Marasmius oreades]|uniref:Uncharacterized protein n=1 Tax=Marasmius oreades TaxID=181124 RepID=A0A9P7UTP9_9AGAR|nr:uncharacterized protein E1B28_008857 [Marasmius oreades]KAG7092506.1 hypothetical protein E1B28_008857 [Marasmius oreades]